MRCLLDIQADVKQAVGYLFNSGGRTGLKEGSGSCQMGVAFTAQRTDEIMKVVSLDKEERAQQLSLGHSNITRLEREDINLGRN